MAAPVAVLTDTPTSELLLFARAVVLGAAAPAAASAPPVAKFRSQSLSRRSLSCPLLLPS